MRRGFRALGWLNRRVRLANEVIALGLVRPLPPAERAAHPQRSSAAERGEPPAGGVPPPRRREPDRAASQADGASIGPDAPGISPGLSRPVGSQANGTGHRVS